jgi:periplasmic mercuric ion binding protein
MKQLSYILITLLLATVVSFSQTKKQNVGKASTARFDTTVVQVPTVVCNSCVNTITKALNKVPGVKSTSVDLKKKTATVAFVSSKVTVARIEKTIANAGYDANNLKRDPAAYEKLDACCKIDSK